jgi:tetratricopeptide (TPR) repeat protein
LQKTWPEGVAMAAGDEQVPPRTVLEQKLRERNQTLAEFARAAEDFARTFGEPGTLSERHLKRLVAGRNSDGSPLGRLRPATARLLERMLGLTADELLSSPDSLRPAEAGELELRQMLSASRRIGAEVMSLLYHQLTAVRRLDRQLGATIAHDEVATKIQQIMRLRSHSLTPSVRSRLAALLAEFGTLAGWQTLDMGSVADSWQYYERAKAVACESGEVAFELHTAAEQAFVLIDVGEAASAVQLLHVTEKRADRATGRTLRSWLAAAHGEALAADGQRSESLRAFDRAEALLPTDVSSADDGPYVALDPVHLARWRGHALARIGEPDAVVVLSSALANLDPTFARAETGLRVDLASAFLAIGEREQARVQVARAAILAVEIGSARQQRRIKQLQISFS